MGRPAPARDQTPEPTRIIFAILAYEDGIVTEVEAYQAERRVGRVLCRTGETRLKIQSAIGGLVDEMSALGAMGWGAERGHDHGAAATGRFRRSAQRLFVELFGEDGKPEKTARIRQWLRSPELRVIEANSHLAGFPMDALYFEDALDRVGVGGFVGARAPVLHLPETGEWEPHPADGLEALGFLGTRNVASVGVRDKDSIFSVFDAAGAAYREHTPLVNHVVPTKAMARGDMAALTRALNSPHYVWHISSHMQASGGRSEFVLDNEFPVTAGDLRKAGEGADKLQFAGKPLVYFNICKGAGSTTSADVAFPAVLEALQARAVIAAHCLVHDRFATAFAGRFYGALFQDGTTVSEAFHAARLSSLKADESVASLFFSLRAAADYALPLATASRPVVSRDGPPGLGPARDPRAGEGQAEPSGADDEEEDMDHGPRRD